MTGWRLAVSFGMAVLSGDARAEEFWVEGPANVAKADAIAQQAAGEKAGLSVRVVRRYVDDQGWRYLVVSDESDAELDAGKAAKALASAIALPVSLFVRDGKSARQVGLIESTASAPASAPVEQDPEVTAILQRSVAAHGGPDGGLAVVDRATTVRFEYERRMESGLVVKHVYLRKGEDRSLAVKVLAGSGIDSETRLVGGAAWLQTGHDPFQPQDVARARELLEQASPSGIVPFVLVFGPVAGNRSEFSRLARGEPTAVAGEAADSLRFEGDRASGPMTLDISQKTGLVVRISFEDGDLVHQYEEYQPVAERLVAPRKITTWREGKVVETTSISALVLDAAPPDGSLATPVP